MKDGGSGGEDTFGVSGGVRVDGSGDWNRWKRGEVVVGKRERVLMSGKREGAECLRKFERIGEQRGGIEWGGDSVRVRRGGGPAEGRGQCVRGVSEKGQGNLSGGLVACYPTTSRNEWTVKQLIRR